MRLNGCGCYGFLPPYGDASVRRLQGPGLPAYRRAKGVAQGALAAKQVLARDVWRAAEVGACQEQKNKCLKD